MKTCSQVSHMVHNACASAALQSSCNGGSRSSALSPFGLVITGRGRRRRRGGAGDHGRACTTQRRREWEGRSKYRYRWRRGEDIGGGRVWTSRGLKGEESRTEERGRGCEGKVRYRTERGTGRWRCAKRCRLESIEQRGKQVASGRKRNMK